MNANISYDNQYTLCLEGYFVFETMDAVLDIWTGTKSALSNLPKMTVLCSKIISFDSSFMAFLIEIKRFCIEHGIRIDMQGLSENKKNFLQAYGVLDILKD